MSQLIQLTFLDTQKLEPHIVELTTKRGVRAAIAALTPYPLQ
ncbi:MAG: hypothetical protein V7L21_20625 [Nostoc sp.]|nr:hypothetical protein [Nostoc sp. NMS9]